MTPGCPKCGAPHAPDQTVCLICGTTLPREAIAPREGYAQQVGYAAYPGSAPIIRVYPGKLSDATRAFQADAAAMAAAGYYPVSQVYQPGSWGCGAFLVALLLCIVLIGILVFIYMLIVKPAGSLVVTYQGRPEPPQ